jgi:integrase
MAILLTDKVVQELAAPAKGNRVTYDADTTGLGVRVTAARRHVFVFRYRTKGSGIERMHTIGDAGHWHGEKWRPGVWNLKGARKEAGTLRQRVDQGGDPMGELHAQRTAPTLSELWSIFEEEWLPSKRPSTGAEYKRQAKTYILPKLGRDTVASVDREQIKALHKEIGKKHPYLANRVLALLSVMFNLAIEKKMRTDNPCARIEKKPEEPRQTYLDPEQIGRLSAALADHPEKISAAAIRLMLLTGCRRGEALASTWAEFDLKAGVWTKPSTNTKAKRLHRIPLSAAAIAVIKEMQVEAARLRKEGIISSYVFPSSKKEAEALQEVRRTWASVCKVAGLAIQMPKFGEEGKPVLNRDKRPVMEWKATIRIHDLRHSFASALVSGGLNLPVIGQLLGHSQPRTTARYSHLYDTTLREAAEKVSALAVPLKGEQA